MRCGRLRCASPRNCAIALVSASPPTSFAVGDAVSASVQFEVLGRRATLLQRCPAGKWRRSRHPSESTARDQPAACGAVAGAMDGVHRDGREEAADAIGLRTLAPDEPGYRGRYQGDVVARDRAYHQGSVYPWLLGRMSLRWFDHGRTDLARSEARAWSSCIQYLETDGLGQICELFDGDRASAGGAVASARSVAEILRCYVEDVLDPAPPRMPNEEKTPQLTP